MTTTITTALNGSLVRNLTLTPGDEVTLAIVVYAVDGDNTPLVYTNPQLAVGYGDGFLPIGTEFTVSLSAGRTPYRLAVDLSGVTTTVAHGYIESPFNYDYTWCMCDSLFPAVLPHTTLTVADANGFDGVATTQIVPELTIGVTFDGIAFADNGGFEPLLLGPGLSLAGNKLDTVGGSSGTVSSVSVVTGNGFAGSVATSTTTPAITLTTTLTGLLKGNGTAMSVATNADLPAMTSTVGGAVPTPPNNTTTFLRGDGTFAAPAGAGTVTNTGTLTASALIVGNGGADVKPLASLGTTTTVLHGNAAGLPTYGAVSLTADVNGILPGANGGTANGFTAFTGPATSLKTFTLPDASSTILTSNAAVTVAQGGTGVATIAANSLVLGAGTSAVTGLAPGTSGNVATSNGTIWTSAAPAGGGAWTLLSVVTASSSATVDVDTTFSSTYDAYYVVGSGITAATDAQKLTLQMKVGGAYDAGLNYAHHVQVMTSGANSYSGVGAPVGNFGAINMTPNGSNAAAASVDFVMQVFNPSSTAFVKQVQWQGVTTTTGPIATFCSGVGINSAVTALTGLRFAFASGNILAGKFRLYGVTN